MNLSDLYAKLAAGELSNLAMATDSDTPGSIDTASQPKIILYANEALKRLYTRFVLSTKDLFLIQAGYLTRYHLSSKYAQSKFDPNAGYTFYIQDTTNEPFLDDVIKVTGVYNGHGRAVPLNRRDNPFSVFTPQPTWLQVPHPQDGQILSVQYQAAHPTLTTAEDSPEIELPDFLTEALTSFIAYKVFDHMNTQESGAKANGHHNTFETICVEVMDRDLISEGTSTSSIRFVENGWR